MALLKSKAFFLFIVTLALFLDFIELLNIKLRT